MPGQGLINKSTVLYRAPYVVPVSRPIIPDGGVLVEGGRIAAVDRFSRLRSRASQVVDVDGRVITPALINCHCHLELSHLASLGEESLLPSDDITAWIQRLLDRRAMETTPQAIAQAGRKALAAQHRRGIALVADIGNHPASRTLGAGSRAEQLFFHELLGLSDQAAETALTTLIPGVAATVHAPYSCHPKLIQTVKERARRHGGLFPIHVAESVEEIEFLQNGGGRFREFLSARLKQIGVLSAGLELAELFTPTGMGPVEYLHTLKALDEQTICVHTVQVTALEVAMIAQSGAKVCLCPGSNRRLGVGPAPVPLFLGAGIMPGLGTDSLASNDTLDLWQEMMVLHADHPELPPELIFSMATQGGAETLGVSGRLGELLPGSEARFLAVTFSGEEGEIYPFLVDRGPDIQVEWLERV